MNGSDEFGITDDLLFGRSEIMQQIRWQVDKITDAGLPLLIEGETGTGKEVLARAIHERSSRCGRPFVKISCSAQLADPSLDSLVFDDEAHEDPTDASEATGTRKEPRAGTVCFDDIGELDLRNQSRLVTLLQDPRSSTRDGQVQILCTTRAPLASKVQMGSFRDDLYYWINVISISVPALRHRRADIPILASHFLKRYAEAFQRNPGPFSQHLLDAFLAADWPGNIRELENAVKRYVVLEGCAEPIIADLQKTAKQGGASGELSLKALRRDAIREFEYNLIVATLNRNHWNRRKTAQDLQISYRSLLYTMEQLGFQKKRSVPAGSKGLQQ